MANLSGESNRTSKVFNPATGEQSAEVKLASKKDVNEAVSNALKAFELWANKPPLQRARVMFKFKELIEKNSDELTKIIVSEHGKVYDDARGSLTRGLEVVEYACGIPQMLKGEFTENVGSNVDSWSIRQPLESLQVVLLLLIFLQWSQCGCFLWQSLVEIHLY